MHAHLNGSLSENTLRQLGCFDENIREYQRLTKLFTRTEKNLQECFELFQIAHNATKNSKNVYCATKSVIRDFYDDKVAYLELRTTPRTEEGN